MDKNHQCKSLMKWMEYSFELEASHKTLEEISDGLAMAQALNQIAPDQFTVEWLSRITPGAGNNWRLKVSNLRKVLGSIIDFYQDVLRQNLTNLNTPDVVKIGEECDSTELAKLLQLILGCAINHHNQTHRIRIEKMKEMEESVQQVIKQSIEDLENTLSGISPTDPEDGVIDIHILMKELEDAKEARDHMAQRCHELDMQVTLLHEEKMSLHAENKQLEERLREFETLDDSLSGSGNRIKEISRQMEKLKEELFKVETSRDDYKLKIELQEKEMLDLHSKLDELQKTADDARHLKDELDILRETADKVAKYEATIASLKIKLEEYGDLKRQVKLLEDKNTEYMQLNLELEEGLKKSGSFRAQLEIYKKKVSELDYRLAEETKRANKIECESKKLQDSFLTVQKEKERLIAERDSLKETNDELKCSQLQPKTYVSPGLLTDTVSETMIPPEIKEKLFRLQHEIKMLRLNQRGPEEDKLVQALLDDSTQRNEQLRQENRQLHQRTLELESLLEERDRNEGTLEQKVNSLNETLKKKELEIQTMEDRHKKYIEKAKNVIKSLDPKQNPGSAAEVIELKTQLIEKHKIIEDMEEEKEQTKLFRDFENKLVTTAFYRLGLVKQREAVDHHLAALSSGLGQSFLQRQRLPTHRKAFTTTFESK